MDLKSQLEREIADLEAEVRGDKNKKLVQEKTEKSLLKQEELRKKMEAREKHLRENFDENELLKSQRGVKIDAEKDGIKYQFFKWFLPLVFKPKSKPDSYINTIFLEIKTTVRSTVLECFPKVLDFGTIPVGYKKIKQIELQNLGQKPMNLKQELLPLYCGFNFLNVLHRLEPGGKAVCSIDFQPEKADEFEQVLKIFDHFAVNILLKG